jgi:hypothetical protein
MEIYSNKLDVWKKRRQRIYNLHYKRHLSYNQITREERISLTQVFNLIRKYKNENKKSTSKRIKV